MHKRMDGGPDLRFRPNPAVSVIKYTRLTLSSSDLAFTLTLAFSSEDAADEFARLLQDHYGALYEPCY